MEDFKEKETAQEAVQFLVQKNITRLFKSLLEMVDDLKNQHNVMLNKVAKQSSFEFTQDINYLTSERSDHVRKRILDMGNECIREINGIIEVFDMIPNEKKLEILLNNKKIIKRTRVEGSLYGSSGPE